MPILVFESFVFYFYFVSRKVIYLCHLKVVGRRILELEATRDLSRIWLHVDMDAFYAAVETLSNPSLEGKPMAVGGLSMISTANYEVCCGFHLVNFKVSTCGYC